MKNVAQRNISTIQYQQESFEPDRITWIGRIMMDASDFNPFENKMNLEDHQAVVDRLRQKNYI